MGLDRDWKAYYRVYVVPRTDEGKGFVQKRTAAAAAVARAQ